MSILHLSKVLIYKLYYDDIKNKDKNKILFSYYDSFVWFHYGDTNNEVVANMKHKTSGVAIETFVWLKPKMYSFW